MEDELTLTPIEGNDVQTDEFAAIREHYENGKELSDAELDKVADTAITYVRDILGYFGEKKVTIDEYEGDEGELILDISGEEKKRLTVEMLMDAFAKASGAAFANDRILLS